MRERLKVESTDGREPDCIVVDGANIPGDLFAETPGRRYPTSSRAWPRRAERVVAAWNAFDGHDMADFDNLVADALKWRAAQLTKQLELI